MHDENASGVTDWGSAPIADTVDYSWSDQRWTDEGDIDDSHIEEFGELMDILGCMQPEL
jgi:hypothetical protein